MASQHPLGLPQGAAPPAGKVGSNLEASPPGALGAHPLGTPPQPPVAASAVEQFIRRPLNITHPTASTVAQSSVGLAQLAAAGSLKACAKLADRLLPAASPADALVIRWHKINALLRLRTYRVAADELAALGDLDAPIYSYEAHGALYPGQRGSMVPFSLYLLRAQMPHYLNDSTNALDALLALNAKCAAAAHAASARDEPPSVRAPNSFAHAPNCRAARIALANLYIARRDWQLAIAELESLAAGASGAAADGPAGAGSALDDALSLLGRMHLQVGNLAAAESAFGRLECAVVGAESSAGVHVNRGLLAMAQGEYSLAHDAFNAALLLEPSSAVAANNRAVCSLHLSRIGEAIGSLEDFLRADPVGHLEPTLVANLQAMYELHSDTVASARRTLEQLVALVGAEDFNLQLQAQARPGAP
ncbi:hypothetical protein T492DRAFT_1023152 [Pavlovales sp. CCMP2436]|nr:hypothetical protein T492DRAFT_1023152 [Pavlovales sp. CCMP2436]